MTTSTAAITSIMMSTQSSWRHCRHPRRCSRLASASRTATRTVVCQACRLRSHSSQSGESDVDKVDVGRRRRVRSPSPPGTSVLFFFGCQKRTTSGATLATEFDTVHILPPQAGQPGSRRACASPPAACAPPGPFSPPSETRPSCDDTSGLELSAAAAAVPRSLRPPAARRRPRKPNERSSTDRAGGRSPVRELMALRHTWSSATGQLHQTATGAEARTLPGVAVPFLVLCHCAAIAGATVWRQFVTETCTPAQHGHPFLRQFAIEELHSWSGPLGHFQFHGSFEAAGTEREPRPLFSFGFHSGRSVGWAM
mmetsp:Transcript_1146/g.2300  ORF Transcript_1146/g.2300 Transcript_1146/m.2300 type:complete len:311 (+) Transcript_1146:578-1510(+)